MGHGLERPPSSKPTGGTSSLLMRLSSSFGSRISQVNAYAALALLPAKRAKGTRVPQGSHLIETKRPPKLLTKPQTLPTFAPV